MPKTHRHSLELYGDTNLTNDYTLDINRDYAAASYSVVRITQDSTTGAQPCLELNQDDTNVVPLKLTDATGSCLMDGVNQGGTAVSDWSFAITIGSSDYIIPLIAF